MTSQREFKLGDLVWVDTERATIGGERNGGIMHRSGRYTGLAFVDHVHSSGELANVVTFKHAGEALLNVVEGYVVPGSPRNGWLGGVPVEDIRRIKVKKKAKAAEEEPKAGYYRSISYGATGHVYHLTDDGTWEFYVTSSAQWIPSLLSDWAKHKDEFEYLGATIPASLGFRSTFHGTEEPPAVENGTYVLMDTEGGNGPNLIVRRQSAPYTVDDTYGWWEEMHDGKWGLSWHISMSSERKRTLVKVEL